MRIQGRQGLQGCYLLLEKHFGDGKEKQVNVHAYFIDLSKVDSVEPFSLVNFAGTWGTGKACGPH
jgi:hypothetical protein